VVLAACIAACRPAQAPMVGVNESAAGYVLRLVRADGRMADVAFPPQSQVRVNVDFEVDYVVMFDRTCRPVLLMPFGGQQNSFSYGGTLFVDAQGGIGYTSDIASSSRNAPVDHTCSNVETPSCNRAPGGTCSNALGALRERSYSAET
jgi:hypothetical protein